VQYQDLARKVEEEGGNRVSALLHAGNVDGALHEMNNNGKSRGWRAVGEAEKVDYDINGIKIPGYRLTVADENGRQVTMNSSLDMASKLRFDKQLDMAVESAKMNATVNHQDAILNEQRRQHDSTYGYQSANLDEQRRHNIVTEGISSARVKAAGAGGSKGKWVQDEDGEWQFLNTGDSSPGMVKEQIKINEDGTATAYDPVSGSVRTVYTPEQARDVARARAEGESKKAGKGWLNLEWDDAKIGKRATEIEKELMAQSQRPQRGDEMSAPSAGRSRPAGPAGGIGRINDNNVGSMKNPGGKTGFKQYNSPDEAVSDWHKQLQLDNGRGIDTIDGLISKYSPASDGNRTSELIKEAERVTGFKAGQHIDLSNPAARVRVMGALFKQEKPASSFLKGRGGYGKRGDGSEKGSGYLGEVKRDDGRISTELSIGVNIDGKEVDIPSLVPTLSKQEVDYLSRGGKPTGAIVEKAVSFARQRMKDGKSVFAGEEDNPGQPPVMNGISSNSPSPAAGPKNLNKYFK